MTNLAKSFAAVLLAGTAPAAANTILFSTGTLPNGTPLRPGQPPAGTIIVRGGVTQVQNGDGEVFSFVGDATFDASVPDVSITDGRVTVSGGRDGATAFTVGGTIATSVNGQNATASFTVDGGAIAAGRVLGGTVTVTAGGITRSFDLGQAFAAALGAAPRPISTAGVAPITAPPAAQAGADIGVTGIDTNQNPRFGTLPGGSEAALLGTIIARQNAATAFDFRQVSDAYLNANLASVVYGERLGSLSSLIATARALALINGIQGGSTRAADLAYLDALLALFRADGFATGAPAATTSSITQYNQIVAAGLPTDLATVTRIVSTWVGGLQTATSGTSGGYSTAQLETLTRYLRSNGVPATAAAADRARIDALFAFLDAGGAFGKTPGVVLPNAGSTLTAGVRSSLASGDYVGSQARFEVGANVPTLYAPAVAIAFDASGAPTQMPSGFVKGALVGVEGASGADWIIGRYATTTRGTDGTHFALAKPYTLTLPTSGTARYTLTHATTPQYIDGRVVTASATDMAIAFAFGTVIKYGLEGSISATDLGGVRTFRFATDGGLAAPSVNARTGGGMIAIGDAIVVTANSDTCGTGSAGCLFRPSLVLGGTSGGIIAGTYLISQTGSFPILGGAVILQGTLPAAVVTPPVVTPPAVTPPFVTPPVVTPPTTGITPVTTYTFASYDGAIARNESSNIAGRSTSVLVDGTRVVGTGERGSEFVYRATLSDNQSGTGWVIGRWSNGTVQNSAFTRTIPAGQAEHYAFTTVRPTSIPTTGLATFGLAQFTTPSLASGVAVTNAQMYGGVAIQFAATPLFGISGTLTLTAGSTPYRYDFASSGGLTAPSIATNRPTGLLALDGGVAVTSNDPSCGTICRFFTGFTLGGTTANVVAGGWLIGLQSGTNVVAGSAVYLQGSPVTTAPTGTVSGTGTAVVIASNTQASQAASFTTDASGLASYTAGTGTTAYTVARGTTTDRGFTRVGDVIGWTRWAGGTTARTDAGGATGSTTYAENNGELVVWGTRATNIPTSGNATYDLLGASAVTLTTDAAPGTVDSATLNVAFGSAPKVGIDLGIRVGGNDYLVSSFGGAASPTMTLDTATMGFGGDLTVSTGNGCTASTCSGGVQGFLAGVGASHAGARFTFQTAPGRGQPTAAGVVTFVRRP